jgi:hypothetical protein
MVRVRQQSDFKVSNGSGKTDYPDVSPSGATLLVKRRQLEVLFDPIEPDRGPRPRVAAFAHRRQ